MRHINGMSVFDWKEVSRKPRAGELCPDCSARLSDNGTCGLCGWRAMDTRINLNGKAVYLYGAVSGKETEARKEFEDAYYAILSKYPQAKIYSPVRNSVYQDNCYMSIDAGQAANASIFHYAPWPNERVEYIGYILAGMLQLATADVAVRVNNTDKSTGACIEVLLGTKWGVQFRTLAEVLSW